MTGKFLETRKPFDGAQARHGGHIGSGPPPGPKKSVNVSVDAEILAAAKEAGINLSKTLEDRLRALTQEAREEKFRQEIRPNIESYNAYIERNGIFGEEFQDRDDGSV